MSVTFIILTALTTIYLTFLTAKGGLTDNRYKSWIKRITKRGWIVFGVNVVVVSLLTVQYLVNDGESKRKDRLLKAERDTRDSTITARIKSGVDSSRQVLFDAMSTAFSKQSLKFDTVRKTIEKIKDSATKAGREPDPTLIIPPDGVTIDSSDRASTHVSIALVSSYAGSSNFKISVYAQVELNDGREVYTGLLRFLDIKSVIGRDDGRTLGFMLSSSDLRVIKVYIVGTYTTISKAQHYSIDELYIYDVKKRQLSTVIGPPKERLKKRLLTEK